LVFLARGGKSQALNKFDLDKVQFV
jgi:hypothetical protein